jgi:hypothetical protein
LKTIAAAILFGAMGAMLILGCRKDEPINPMTEFAIGPPGSSSYQYIQSLCGKSGFPMHSVSAVGYHTISQGLATRFASGTTDCYINLLKTISVVGDPRPQFSDHQFFYGNFIITVNWEIVAGSANPTVLVTLWDYVDGGPINVNLFFETAANTGQATIIGLPLLTTAAYFQVSASLTGVGDISVSANVQFTGLKVTAF